MKTRVIFLDDEPGLCRKLQTALEERGYTVAHPRTLEEALREINLHGAELLVHCSHSTQTHWRVCEAIFNTYPHFPSLHLATGPVSAENHFTPKGPFHQNLRHLAPEREFLKRVRRMIFLGRLNSENIALKKAVGLLKRVDRIFDTLDTDVLKNRAVEFFGQEFRAQNAIWLNPGAYSYHLHDMWKVVPLNAPEDEMKAKKHELVSWQAVTPENVSSVFKEINEELPSGWELRSGNVFVEHRKQNRYSVCFVPVVSPKSKQVLGHIMLQNPLLWGDLGLDKTLPNLMRLLGRHLDHAISFGNAKNLSYIDDLTELYNQRYLKLVLDKEIYRAQRQNSAFAVLFMDIDHFKRVNDTSGHIVGSKVLIELSKIVKQNIRAMDYGFRYGGDEFICVLVGTDSQQAAQVAERIRKTAEESTFDIDGVQVKVTLSIGIASYPEHATTKEEIIEMADRAMYCGKSRSRNVVYIAS